MEWAPNPEALRGRVAVVAGATRGAGRGIAAALAADSGRSRYNQRSLSAAELAREYGFTDLDGSQPDAWANM